MLGKVQPVLAGELDRRSPAAVQLGFLLPEAGRLFEREDAPMEAQLAVKLPEQVQQLVKDGFRSGVRRIDQMLSETRFQAAFGQAAAGEYGGPHSVRQEASIEF